jgi:hypothetical protein
MTMLMVVKAHELILIQALKIIFKIPFQRRRKVSSRPREGGRYISFLESKVKK